MKTTTVLALSGSLSSAMAYPQDYQLKRRTDEICTVTVWETVQGPDYIIWVEEAGNIISQGVAAATLSPTSNTIVDISAPAAAPTVQTVAPTTAPTDAQAAPPDTLPPKPGTSNPAQDQTTGKVPQQGIPSATTTSLESPNVEASVVVPIPDEEQAFAQASNDNSTPGYGIGWSNYKGVEGNSPCKTFDDADKEWSQMTGYDVVRVYGADCGQPGMALQLATKYKKKVFAGVYFLDDRLASQVQAIVDGVHSAGTGWDNIDTISIGNEDVHRGEKTPQQIFDSVSSAKSQLRAAGYNGPVVHVDSQDAILAHPELCGEQAGNYIAANVHPFFNSQTSSDQAGNFVQDQIELLRQCGVNQRTHRRRDEVRVRVTETGWPKGGDANGAAIPSKDNQMAALGSIKSKFADDVIMFSAFNNYWMKDDASTFNTEHYWGLLDD